MTQDGTEMQETPPEKAATRASATSGLRGDSIDAVRLIIEAERRIEALEANTRKEKKSAPKAEPAPQKGLRRNMTLRKVRAEEEPAAKRAEAGDPVVGEVHPAADSKTGLIQKIRRVGFNKRPRQSPETATIADVERSPVGPVASDSVSKNGMTGLAKLTGFRPTRRQIAIAVAILIVLLRPWVVFWAAVMIVMALIISHMVMGPERFSEMWQNVFGRYAKRYPERAERLRARADKMAMRLDAILDRLPEKWTAGLYLPDFSRASERPVHQKMENDPFDRLIQDAQRR